MERRGCSLGCIIAALGLLLSGCLLPYTISSAYSIAITLLDAAARPEWLWGAWLRTIVGESDAAYMLLAEGPVCCVGIVGLLIAILGLVLLISDRGRTDAGEEPAYHPEVEDWR